MSAISKFAEHTHAGIHLETLEGARDPNVRTIRINLAYRGVVLAAGGAKYVLLTVMHHDDAIAYAVSRRFTVNRVFGLLEMRDQQRIEEIEQALPPTPAVGLFSWVSDNDLRRLGIEDVLIPLIRAVTTDEQLASFRAVLPTAQFDVLTGLSMRMTVNEIFDELAQRIVADIDTSDLFTAAGRTPERVKLVSGPHELASILAHPFDVWRVFLHPTQHDIAYRPSYAGPALITGSAGTGKTVTAVHRAVFLAGRLPADGSKILMTTYTRTLADTLRRQIDLLTDDKVIRSRIDVLGADQLAHQIVKGRREPKVIEPEPLRALWQAVAADAPSYFSRTGTLATFSPAFLQREWEQVILAQQITTADGYRTAVRRGRGDALRADQRDQVWAAVNGAVARLAKQRQSTYLQLADEAVGILATSGPIYRHVIVDEGQDLHPSQWRLLRAAVAPGPDDLFLMADPYQRIYDNHVSLKSLGIEVSGRSRRLTLNYRTTHEILAWSIRVLNGDSAVSLDDTVDTLAGYRSLTHGRPPALTVHRDRAGELSKLIERVGTWMDDDEVEPEAIGVAARNGQLVKAIIKALTDAHIPVADEKTGGAGVRVASMHRLKGLEFQCLAVVGLDAGVLPSAQAVTDPAEDPLSHRQDMQRERCLLFVAMTRARDALYLSHTGTRSSLLPA
ncbi:hypothetical protein F4553_007769 [Allocatelliglobosispora scoriae]|uniref:DNA 3'-5' helicase n=1 Tax=Allocatelliglobosispora scoriae TaxID=643052 RepID=A0A841C357_9ACTN|nr:UvrD-helicase domain-containing protein [Allocatelliglobosispora scoriae]MBB5874335.1 hypothetical protein [Allocatelliglobosispora scoriae]